MEISVWKFGYGIFSYFMLSESNKINSYKFENSSKKCLVYISGSVAYGNCTHVCPTLHKWGQFSGIFTPAGSV